MTSMSKVTKDEMVISRLEGEAHLGIRANLAGLVIELINYLVNKPKQAGTGTNHKGSGCVNLF